MKITSDIAEPGAKSILQVLYLGFIWRNYGYLAGKTLGERATTSCCVMDELYQTNSEPDLVHVHPRHILLDFSRLAQIEENTASDNFRQGRHLVVESPRDHILTISDPPIVETFRGESTDEWVHAVLNRKHGSLIASLKQPLKETSCETCLYGILTVGRSWELILITDQDDTFWIQVERYKD